MRNRFLLFGLLCAGLGCHPREMTASITGVQREYSSPATETWNACMDAVRSLQLGIWDDAHHDALGGEFVAHRNDGSDFRIVVEALDRARSQVVVHVAIGDAHFADLIHERIAEKLGWAEARPDPSGGNSLQGRYPDGIGPCVTRARDTLTTLDIDSSREDIHDDWAQLDGRCRDSTPVRIRIDREADGGSRVTFLAGVSASDECCALAHRMKEEFERGGRP